MPRLLIDDGCTLDGVVPATARTPEVRFRYRPALPEAVYEVQHAMKAGGRQEAAGVVAILAAHVVSWDVEGTDGHTVPVTPEMLKKVPYRAQQAMLDFVCGYRDHEGDAKN